MSIDNAVEERGKFKSAQKIVLSCQPCTLDHPEGDDASVIFLMGVEDGTPEPIVISMRDSRLLVLRLLISLWTADDEFAGEVLEKCFAVDDDGYFRWPKSD